MSCFIRPLQDDYGTVEEHILNLHNKPFVSGAYDKMLEGFTGSAKVFIPSPSLIPISNFVKIGGWNYLEGAGFYNHRTGLWQSNIYGGKFYKEDESLWGVLRGC